MAEKTKIAWCDHTFNFWRGCAKVSPGCEHCYAETWSRRQPGIFGTWGPNGTRVLASETSLETLYRWERKAIRTGISPRVFVNDMSDFFEDNHVVERMRDRAWQVMQDCEHVTFLLLTKRPENFARWVPWANGSDVRVWKNVWLGVTCEDQEQADRRIPLLLETPAAVRFLSCEPLLKSLKLDSNLGGTRWMGGQRGCNGQHRHEHPHEDGTPGTSLHHHHDDRCKIGLDWVIVGGESGPQARPCQVEWIRSVVDQCREASVPCFVKQLGALAAIDYYTDQDDLRESCLVDGRVFEPVRGGWSQWDWRTDRYQPKPGTILEMELRDPKGGDPAEWPEDLRVREFPKS